MSTIAAQLQAVLRRALATLPEPPPTDFDASVNPSGDARFGDYQTNVAMTLAKARRTNPRALATAIIDALNADAALADISAPPEVAGAGFINFRLKPAFLADTLRALDADAARLGVPAPTHARRVVVDLSGPNIAKPMHVGHLRSTIIGDCLARVARFVGHEVITDNHLGDWGTQFGLIIYGWKRHPDPDARAIALLTDPLAELVKIYQAAAEQVKNEKAREVAEIEKLQEFAKAKGLDEEQMHAWVANEMRPRLVEIYRATNICRNEVAKLQSGDPENTAIWRRCVDISRAELDKIYAELDVHFDHQFGESFFNDKLVPLVEKLERDGVAQPSEGALVAFFPDDPKLAERPAIIRKRDGAFNYATTDLATYEQRVNEFHADTLWYVVGSPQALHFEQLNAIVRRMGYPVPLTHIPFGSILGEDRKIMRTRSGENVALRDLLDEAVERARTAVEQRNADLPAAEKTEIARVIGLGAVKYAELSQHRLTDYIFSWDRMLSFQGNTAPYLQNAYVRVQSIFRKLEDSGQPQVAAAGALTEPAELGLAKKLAQFAEAVPAVLDDFRPNLLANYLYELANDFHGFYEACPVLKADEPTRSTRLVLCRVTARALRVGLGLLGIEVPARM